MACARHASVLEAPATSAAAARPATSTTAAATAATLLRLVHAERTAVDGLAVDLRDRLLRLGVGAHRHEREAARATGVAIHHDVDVGDLAELREQLADRVGGGLEGQVANVEPVTHGVFSSRRRRGSQQANHPVRRRTDGGLSAGEPPGTGERTPCAGESAGYHAGARAATSGYSSGSSPESASGSSRLRSIERAQLFHRRIASSLPGARRVSAFSYHSIASRKPW